MTNPQKVYDFLKKNPRQMFCDDCLEKKTGVDRHEVNTVALPSRYFQRNSAGYPQRACKGAARDTRWQPKPFDPSVPAETLRSGSL
jgi:hypothetical protein